MRVDILPTVVTVSATSARLLTELVIAEIAVRAKAPKPAHLLPGGVDIDLLPDGRWQARLEFEAQQTDILASTPPGEGQ